MIFEEKKIDSCRIYEGAILNVRKDTVTAVKGQAYREIIEHNGAVAIVPVTAEGSTDTPAAGQSWRSLPERSTEAKTIRSVQQRGNCGKRPDIKQRT